MGRPKRKRSSKYKSYYEKGDDGNIPESTLRSLKKRRIDVDVSIGHTEGSEMDDVTQTNNLSFVAADLTDTETPSQLHQLERQVSELNSDNTQVNSSASNCSMEENEDENTEVNNDINSKSQEDVERELEGEEEDIIFHHSFHSPRRTDRVRHGPDLDLEAERNNVDPNSSMEEDDTGSSHCSSHSSHSLLWTGRVRHGPDLVLDAERNNANLNFSLNEESDQEFNTPNQSSYNSTSCVDPNSSMEEDDTGSSHCSSHSSHSLPIDRIRHGPDLILEAERNNANQNFSLNEESDQEFNSPNQSSSNSSSSSSPNPRDVENFDSGGEQEASVNEDEENEDNPNHLSGQSTPEPEDCDRVQKDPFTRLKYSFTQHLNLQVNISVGEVLADALTLCKKHNWSHREKEDLMKFCNAILNNGKVVPDSRYLLDQHFYTKEDMTFCFHCQECSAFLGRVSASSDRPSQIVCEDCKFLNILSDLNNASYFVVFDVHSQLELLLSNPTLKRSLVNPVDFINSPEDGCMRDLHHGSMYQKFANYVHINVDQGTKVISFTLSIDGAALCSFASQSIVPCFLMINELPPVLRMGNLVLAGLWFGKTKEKMDLFLPPIVDHIAQLSVKPFKLKLCGEELSFVAFLIACCADSVARCDIQGIHAHRGDYPCSWCLIEGEEFDNVRIFRFQEPAPPRTLENFLRYAEEALAAGEFVYGVKYLTPLAGAPLFHCVNSFLVDQMHAKDEGTTKSFLKEWHEAGKKVVYCISTQAKTKKLKHRFKHLTPPREFRKSVRSIEDLAYWTGREFENWGMYLSVPLLIDILPPRYLHHWSLYVQGMHILHSSGLSLEAIDLAEELLEEFCSKTEQLYDPYMLRFNLHILRHFCENARRWGPLFALSAYPFERGNQDMKNLINSVNFIPNQVCRGLSENQALMLIQTMLGTANTRSFAESIDPKITLFKS